MEPPYLPQLVIDELAQGQHELPMLVVVEAIVRQGPNRQWCFEPQTLGLEMFESEKQLASPHKL
jgi:hypothetical protein